jgi:predicted Zn finger-like uncharacterized protein
MSGRKHISGGISSTIMQVICPNCRARYAVDPRAIGLGGRTVQCVSCSHRWFETVPDFAIHPQPAYTAAFAAPPQKARVHWGRWIGAIVVLVIVAGVAAFAYRDQLQSRLPDTWRTILSFDVARGLFAPSAKATAGAPDRPRLELDLAASKIEWVDGRYVMRGELFNAGQASGSTTVLKLVFRKGDDLLDERLYSLIEGPIAPGGRLSFTRQLDDPPDGTTNVVPIVE